MDLTGVKELLATNFDLHMQDETHYIEAFTHSSFVNENRNLDLKDNERIEFLGDAVLELVVSNYLYRNYPEMDEGKMSSLRALIVREESLSKRAVECGFDQFVRLGNGEEASNGRKRPSLLCDLFESVLGAIYLDLGLDAIEHFMSLTIYPKIKNGEFMRQSDAKTALQEELQKDGAIQLAYELIKEEGPAHEKRFEVAVRLYDEIIGRGVGHSKKSAEQAAAANALEMLKK
ncbi:MULTISPECIES: ribonuclease III [Aerococcus]|jgi:ribonuclease-3|uniref:Ribonuclease 3 n=1 Tax=Aerococcus agrisoli TaxID=2487350 RepID=A0A3N4G2E6_9LACT|nr:MULTISPECIES: ribonuclease III [Aerococcus]OYQ67090.1 ribonuclease III [Aerococcus sp. 1KP-2016]RPA57123.1 ribonuclease III [Aerococcus agrisoli]